MSSDGPFHSCTIEIVLTNKAPNITQADDNSGLALKVATLSIFDQVSRSDLISTVASAR